MNYNDLDFARDLLPEIRQFLPFTFSEMRMTVKTVPCRRARPQA